MRSVEEILRRYTKSMTRKEQWRSLYQDAYRLTQPNRDLYTYSNTEEGTDKQTGVYTSTGIVAARNFVNRIQSTLTPPFKRWAELKPGIATEKDGDDQDKEILNDITDILFSYIHTSNFDQAIGETYWDLVVGTSALLILPGIDDSKPLNYIAVPIAQLGLEEGPYGTVGAVYRTYDLDPYVVKQQWPDADFNPETDQNGSEKDKVALIETTYYDYEKKVYFYCVLLKGGKKKIVERTYKSNPWVITRWSKMPEENYGRGPAIDVLPDLKSLNTVREISLWAYMIKAKPPMTVTDDSVIDPEKFSLHPSALNIVERNNGPNGPSVQTLDIGGDVATEQFKLEEMKAEVKKVMLDDQLPDQAGAVRSATEIVERMRQAQVDIGSSFGRLMTELIRPIIVRSIDILYQKGIVDIPSEDINEFLVKVEITSPIAKQQALEDLQSFTQGVQMLFSLSPELANRTLKMDEGAEYAMNKIGIPARFVRSEKERAEYDQRVAAAQAEAQEDAVQQEVDMDQAKEINKVNAQEQ